MKTDEEIFSNRMSCRPNNDCQNAAIWIRNILLEGQVNIFNLAKNTGTSVDQIERFWPQSARRRESGGGRSGGELPLKHSNEFRCNGDSRLTASIFLLCIFQTPEAADN